MITAFGKLPPGIVLLDQQIPDTINGGYHPRPVDIYAPLSGAEQALISLHGGGGTKLTAAFVGRVSKVYTQPPTVDDVNWTMINYWNTAFVFPQGTACTAENAVDNPYNPNGVTTASDENPEGVYLWSNGMYWSGSNSEQFLVDLNTYLFAEFPSIAQVHLHGHSAGGMMAGWMYLNRPIFHHFAVTSAPTPILNVDWDGETASLSATPSSLRPFFCQLGLLDTNLGIEGGIAGAGSHWTDDLWLQQPAGLTKANVKGSVVSGVWVPQLSEWLNEMLMQQLRIDAYNTANSLAPQTFDPNNYTQEATELGFLRTWSYSSGRNLLRLLTGSNHKAEVMTRDLRTSLYKSILTWIRAT